MPEVGQRRRSHLFGAMLWFVLVPVLLLQPAWAQPNFIQQGPKLVGTNAIGMAGQGRSIAVSADGNTALVGGPTDNSSNGAVWVFTRSNGIWTQQGSELIATGNVGAPSFGSAVALSADGNTAAVGGSADNTSGNTSAGAVWIFTRNNGVWTQQGSKLVGTGVAGSGAAQGTSVALSNDGNTVIVGGPGDGNNSTGAAWVFVRSLGAWAQQGNKLVGQGSSPGIVQKGMSVALSGDGSTALVGAPRDNLGVGATWVFVLSNGAWTQQGDKLVGTGGVGAGRQGASAALSDDGNTAAVGGFGDNSSAGAAWVFTRSSGAWTQQGSKLVGTGGVGAQQGSSLSLSADGNTMAVGGPADSGGVGAAWIFARRYGVWTPRQKLVGTGSEGNIGARLGGAVALSSNGRTVLAGGSSDNNGIGAAWVFLAGPAHDFNGDGFSDIAWRNANGDTATWLMTVNQSGGAQILSSADYGLVDNSWQIVGQRDFNGDGKADLLWSNTNGDTSIWLMNGTQVSSTTGLGFVGNGWSIAGTGDFNGDGYGDILWRNANGDTSIWLMTGTPTQVSVLSANDIGLVPTIWTVAGIGDFNGDGMSDILWRDNSGNVVIWLMNGAQALQGGEPGQVATTWSIVGTGDFNGDGDADILWRDSEGNTAVWLMNGLQFAQIGALGMVPLGWSVAETGDFNFDGKADILWRDTNSGAATFFYMNGTQVSQIVNLGVVPTSWIIQGVNAD